MMEMELIKERVGGNAERGLLVGMVMPPLPETPD